MKDTKVFFLFVELGNIKTEENAVCVAWRVVVLLKANTPPTRMLD